MDARRVGIHWIGAGLLGLAAGCTVSVQPWSKPVAAPSDPGFGPQGVMTPQQALNRPPGQPPGPQQYPGGNNEYLTSLLKRNSDLEADRTISGQRLGDLEGQLRDRESKLQRAIHEINDSTTQVRRAKEEIRHYNQELEDLRDRVRRVEDERQILKPLVDEILSELDRKKEPLKFRGPTR